MSFAKNSYMIFLTFMGQSIVITFRYISNKTQRYTVYLFMETALHFSGGIFTHHQEHTQLCLHHPVLVKPLLLTAAIVEAFVIGKLVSTEHW